MDQSIRCARRIQTRNSAVKRDPGEIRHSLNTASIHPGAQERSSPLLPIGGNRRGANGIPSIPSAQRRKVQRKRADVWSVGRRLLRKCTAPSRVEPLRFGSFPKWMTLDLQRRGTSKARESRQVRVRQARGLSSCAGLGRARNPVAEEFFVKDSIGLADKRLWVDLSKKAWLPGGNLSEPFSYYLS
jgi:hypothetical protein